MGVKNKFSCQLMRELYVEVGRRESDSQRQGGSRSTSQPSAVLPHRERTSGALIVR
jgi:hypothetical protein